MAVGLPWRVLQIADSAFPTGGFAHSAGLEAAMHFGGVRTTEDLDVHIRSHLWNVGHASLPFVAETCRRPHEVWAMDARVEALLTNHVANRASRTQGRAFIATCARVFDQPELAVLAARARTQDVSAHYAPLFGASLAALAVDLRDALALHLHLALRGVTSAAVRLGIVGPHEAQRLQWRHATTLEAVLACCQDLAPSDAATTAPLIDVFGATHDLLYARLFQS
jgi:urease accessory protein